MKTINRLFQFVIMLVVAVGFTGCDDDNPIDQTKKMSKRAITYYPREVNYLLVENKSKYSESYYSSSSYSNTEIEASEYLLYASTCNVFTEGVRKYYGKTCDYRYFQHDIDEELAMIDDRINEIEAMFDDLHLYYENKFYGSSGESLPPPCDVDYRTSALTGVNITCDTELFGVEAGGSLNEYVYIFLVDHSDLGNHLISTDNKLVTASADDMCGMSIEKYLSVKPYAPVNITFGFKEVPVNLPQTVTFNVDMEIDGNKIVSSTSEPITLI